MAVAGLAQSGSDPGEPPDAKAILTRMADFLLKTPRMSVTVHSSYDAVQPKVREVEWNDVRRVTPVRPDRLRIETQRSDGARTLLVFDGKEITTFDESARVCAQALHPGSVDDAVVYFVRDLGMRLPLAVLLLTRLPAELNEKVQSVEYVEKTATLSGPAHHLVGRTATVHASLRTKRTDLRARGTRRDIDVLAVALTLKVCQRARRVCSGGSRRSAQNDLATRTPSLNRPWRGRVSEFMTLSAFNQSSRLKRALAVCF
jgi:hypothetical protein